MSETVSQSSPSQATPANKAFQRANSKAEKQAARAYIQGLIALVAITISVIVAFVVYIPMITEISSVRSSTTLIDLESARYEKKYQTINTYDSDLLASELTVLRTFIPDDLKVTELAAFINKGSEQYNLKVSRLGIQETKEDIAGGLDDTKKTKLLGSAKDAQVTLGRVQGPFTFIGTKDSIFKFLDFLVQSGYATHFDKVYVSKNESQSSGDDQWMLSFSAVYYYLTPATSVPAKRELVPISKAMIEKARKGALLIPPVVTPSVQPSITPASDQPSQP